MKKLVYLLVLSLCMGSLTAAVPKWIQPALAEDKASSDETAKKAEEEAAKKKAEEEAAKKKAEEEAAKKKAEEEAAKKKAEEEAAKKKAEEEAAKKKAEEEAAKKAEEEAAKKKAEEEAAKKADEEAAKKAEEEAAKKKAEEEAAKKAEEEAAKKRAEEEAAKKAEEEAAKKAEEEAAKKAEEEAAKKAEEEAAKKDSEKKARESEKPEKKEKSEKKEKEEQEEQEYKLDLADSSEFLLSEALKAARIDIHLGDISKIEPENKEVSELLAWERVKKGSDDYTFTVLKDFKEARLRIRTEKTGLILVLKNGARAEEPQAVRHDDASASKDRDDGAMVSEADVAPEGEEVPEKQEETEVGNEESHEAAPAGDLPAEEDVQTSPEQDEQLAAGQEAEPIAAEKTAGDMPSEERETGERIVPEAQPSAEETGDETIDEQDADSTGAESAAFEAAGEEAVGAESAAFEASGEQEADAESAVLEAPAEDGNEQEASGEEGVGEVASGEEVSGEEGAGEEASGEDGAGEEGAGEDGAGDQGADDGMSDEDLQDAAEVPEDAEAWFRQGDALISGALAEIVNNLAGGETLYIRSSAVLSLPGAPLKLLSSVTLKPDGSVFDDTHTLHISKDDPQTVRQPQLIEASALGDLGDTADLYIWVAKDEEEPSQPEDPEEPEEPAIGVTVSDDYREAAWSRVSPTFTLSGIPEGADWSYAAIIYNRKFVPISGNVYKPDEQGQYTLSFTILDKLLGDIMPNSETNKMAASEVFTLWLDWTEPEEVTITVDGEKDYTLHIRAVDRLSGVEAVSVNGGKLWQKLSNNELFTYTGKEEEEFEEGAIQIRDVAGNIFKSTESYTITESDDDDDDDDDGGDDGDGGDGGGGGGDGASTPKLSHASGDGEEGSEYDALLLELPDEPMEQLTVGGEPMQLTLSLEEAEAPGAPVGDKSRFTASLRSWDSADDSSPDTLLLEAEPDANLGDRFTYDWQFNGEVYRLLANSGIKYLALKVGDDVAAFPTEGFTGGTKYTELKMLGVSTKKFDYTLAMKFNLDPGHFSTMSDSDFSQECDLSIRTEVENMNYELSSSSNSIMYFYNVFLGPEDMLNRPFGEYRADS